MKSTKPNVNFYVQNLRGHNFCDDHPVLLVFGKSATPILIIFMGMWVIVNWWVWRVPDFHFRKLEAMSNVTHPVDAAASHFVILLSLWLLC